MLWFLTSLQICTDAENKFQEANNTCTSRCGSGKYQLATLKCIDTCVNYYYYMVDDQNACTDTCSKYVDSQNKCVNKCKENESYLVSYDNMLHCSQQCNTYHFVLQNDQFHKLCVDECAGDTPYFRKVDILHTQCMRNCPENYLLNGYQCVERCDYYTVESGSKMVCAMSCPQYYRRTSVGNQCMESCPDGFPFLNDRECVSVCPEKIYDQSMTCLSQCQYPGYFIYNHSSGQKICMPKKCPDYAPYAENSGECTALCNSGNYEKSATDDAES